MDEENAESNRKFVFRDIYTHIKFNWYLIDKHNNNAII